MIPAVIVPILNGPHLLDRMLTSIDHPVGKVVVIDNGDVVDTLTGGRHMYPFTVRVIQPGHNLGVAASWNLGIKATPDADWWLIVNHDIVFGAGDLDRLAQEVQRHRPAVYNLSDYAAFGVTYHAIRAAGFWDENIHPAYDEDVDWAYRAAKAGVEMHEVEFTGTHVGSATIGASAEYRGLNGVTHGENDRYYAAKWGGQKQGGETFSTPFNRGGHLGDWRLDIERLRLQAWRRRQG